MARKEKIDNAILKRFARQEKKRKQAIRKIRKYFLIVCEGEKTEPNYFEGLKKDLPVGVLSSTRIDIEGTGKNTISLLDAAIKIRDKKEKASNRKFDQVWIVFDRDNFPANNFDSTILKAQAASPPINCAWSNEAFEIWYLLHFQFFQQGMNRQRYKELIEREVSKKTGIPFTYQKNAKDMYSILKAYGNQEQAIEWAKSLQDVFGERKDFSMHNPCTLVHKLIEELLSLTDAE